MTLREATKSIIGCSHGMLTGSHGHTPGTGARLGAIAAQAVRLHEDAITPFIGPVAGG